MPKVFSAGYSQVENADFKTRISPKRENRLSHFNDIFFAFAKSRQHSIKTQQGQYKYLSIDTQQKRHLGKSGGEEELIFFSHFSTVCLYIVVTVTRFVKLFVWLLCAKVRIPMKKSTIFFRISSTPLNKENGYKSVEKSFFASHILFTLGYAILEFDFKLILWIDHTQVSFK